MNSAASDGPRLTKAAPVGVLGPLQRRPIEVAVPRGRRWASIVIEFEPTGAGLLGLYLGPDRIVQLCGIPKSGRKVAVLDLRMERAEVDRLKLIATLLVSAPGRQALTAARYIELPLEPDATTFSPDIVSENAIVLSADIIA